MMVPVIISVAIVFVVILFLVITNLIYVASPNEALIFAGAKEGYRVIKGGKGILIPLLETVHRMDLTLIAIDVAVTDAYSKGGIPLDVSGVANVKVAGERPELDNAIQRFVGLNRKQIEMVAKDTLEGALRGIVATMTPEELNENKAKFESALEGEARDSLRLLGLSLDTLKVQSVSDKVDYLSAIGEKDKASLFQRARIAEAKNKGEADIQSAENKQIAEIANLDGQIRTLQAEAARRILNAKTAGTAMVAEEEGRVKALVARAKADVGVQTARIDQVRLQLEADVVAPAEAQMEASIREARGNAAKISEEGRAVAEGFKALVEQWQKTGGAAREILLLQKLDQILGTLMSSVEGVHVDRYSILANPGEKGEGGNGGRGSDFSMELMKTLENLKGGAGLDVVKGLANLTGSGSDGKAQVRVKPAREAAVSPSLARAQEASRRRAEEKGRDAAAAERQAQAEAQVRANRQKELQKARFELEPQAPARLQVKRRPVAKARRV
jgi:flotillin